MDRSRMLLCQLPVRQATHARRSALWPSSTTTFGNVMQHRKIGNGAAPGAPSYLGPRCGEGIKISAFFALIRSSSTSSGNAPATWGPGRGLATSSTLSAGKAGWLSLFFQLALFGSTIGTLPRRAACYSQQVGPGGVRCGWFQSVQTYRNLDWALPCGRCVRSPAPDSD
eukprot:scaffold3793_cov397-Prasinococcus_capsulatus_cf.AAC.7